MPFCPICGLPIPQTAIIVACPEHGDLVILDAFYEGAGDEMCGSCRKITRSQYQFCPNCGVRMDGS